MIDPGTLVLEGRFRVLQPLGSGGMGEVYLGEQVSLGRKVAIKMLHPDLFIQPGITERFRREAKLLSAVEHAAVVRVIDYGETENGACLVMEFVEGESLYATLQASPMPLTRALPVLYQLAEGLMAIHDKGIVHRDLKPENVLLTRGPRGEQARLLDFGIARLAQQEVSSNLSQVGVVMGTPEYLSPEQALGMPVDERSDLYSFGVLAYAVLAGQLPFPGPGPNQFIAQHAGTPPRPLLEAAPSLANQPALVALVMQLLEKEPARRPQQASVVVDALGAITRGLSNTSGALPAAAPPVPSPSSLATFVFGAPVPARGGTALSGARTASMGPATTGGTLASRPQNLTVMLTTLQDFTARTSRQTHEQNARMLETHDELLLPLVRALGGRLVQKRGDALLIVFSTPSTAVLCGMAIQDRLWRHNQGCPPAQQLRRSSRRSSGAAACGSDAGFGESLSVAIAEGNRRLPRPQPPGIFSVPPVGG